MKTTALFALLALGATSASAAAVSSADAEAKWCQLIGQPCYKVKRTAEAFAEALASSGGFAPADSAVARRANAAGGLADQAKRGIADLAGIVATTQNSPRDFYDSLALGEHFSLKREALPEAAASADAEAQKWCQLVGQPCYKVRRAAEAVLSTIDGFGADSHVAKRDADADADADAKKWCQLIGQPCYKRSVEARCHAPGGACAAARRDLHGVYNAAREVLASLPAQ